MPKTRRKPLYATFKKRLEQLRFLLPLTKTGFYVYQKTEKLQYIGHPTTFQWIPGHSGLIENEKADLSAKSKPEKGGKLTEQ